VFLFATHALAAFAAVGEPALPAGGAAAPSLIDPTDILALVAMALFSIHRIEIRGTDARAFPYVPQAAFDDWYSRAVFAKSLSINACFLKFALNTAWYYGTRHFLPVRVVAGGGMALFVTWLGVLAYSMLLSSWARKRASALGIVVGRRVVADVSTPAATTSSSSGD